MDTTKAETKQQVEIKRYRSFQVEVVNNGFVATIGCQRLVFKTLLEVADVLKEYWNSPTKVEAEYMRNSLSSGQELPAPPIYSNTGAALTLRER